jgi:hypothetical protein
LKPGQHDNGYITPTVQDAANGSKAQKASGCVLVVYGSMGNYPKMLTTLDMHQIYYLINPKNNSNLVRPTCSTPFFDRAPRASLTVALRKILPNHLIKKYKLFSLHHESMPL